MYKTIIVPIDLAHVEAAEPMISAAKKLAAPDCRFILLNVVADVPSYVAAELPGEYLAKTKARGQDELKAIAEKAGISADIFVRTGKPSIAILEVAEAEKAEMVVVASHDPGLEDYFIGSTASRVVRHAHCAVLVMR